MLKHFTQEQMQEIAQYFNLEIPIMLKVKDGFVKIGDKCWWRCEDGPQEFTVEEDNDHWDNMLKYPNAYQIEKPNYVISYVD